MRPIIVLNLLVAHWALAPGGCSSLYGQQSAFPETAWWQAQQLIADDSSAVTTLAIQELVEQECQNDYDCLNNAYERLSRDLLDQQLYLLAIPLAEEWRRISFNNDDTEAEAFATETLALLYNFINDAEKTEAAKVRLVALYGKTGNEQRKLVIEAMLIEALAWHDGRVEEAIEGIEALRKKAEDRGYLEFTSNELLIRLKYLYEEFGYWDKLEILITQLEVLVAREERPHSAFVFHALSGRADLLRRDEQFVAAKKMYKKALANVRRERGNVHDSWNEIYLLHRLANLEKESGRKATAKRYLDTVYAIADQFDMHDRILITQGIRIEIAEAEGDFKAAYQALQEQQARQAIIDSIAAGFDLQRFNLELDLKEMNLQQERQEADLKLSQSQSLRSLYLAALIAVICLALAGAWFRQRSARLKLRKQNELISQQSNQLRQLDAAKSRFFANISHELRTPLTLMLGPIRRLQQQSSISSLERDKLLATAMKGGQQLRQLTNEILDLAKLEAGNMDLRPEPTDMNAFFQHYLGQFESLADQRGIDYQFKVDLPTNTMAELDREKCRQILYNLLSNAFKFTSTGGGISAAISLNGEELQMVVRDNGRGIKPNELNLIFNRYFQSSNAGENPEGGAGIGLALCKEYADLFGGRITVDSQPDQGSTFSVFLPLRLFDHERVESRPVTQAVAFAGSAATKTQAAAAVDKTKQDRILVVEDNPDMQYYLSTILGQSFNLVCVENGVAALKMLASRTEPFDLVISDWMMPEMDGATLLTRIKAQPKFRSLPFIMLTARAGREDQLNALRIGVDDYLTKPFDEEELLARIANLLANQIVRRENQEAERQKVVQPKLAQPDQEWLEHFEAFVRKEVSNSQLTVGRLTQEFAMSESTLLRQLKRLTGLSPRKYIREMRLDVARDLLERRRYKTVGRVAAEVGYTDARSFSRNYRQRFGASPSDLL